jgi:hypothetical protein
MEDDKLRKKIESINKPLTDQIKKLQETLLPTMKAIQDSIGKIPKMAEIVQPEINRIEIPIDQNLASEFHKRLIKWIQDFDKELDNEFEVGVRLVSFGQTVTFHLENIGYWNPSLISFSGFTENGEPVELIQHVSQISILLLKMKRKDPQKPKRPIGFASWENEESDKT